jgi:hypothetical protein
MSIPTSKVFKNLWHLTTSEELVFHMIFVFLHYKPLLMLIPVGMYLGNKLYLYCSAASD